VDISRRKRRKEKKEWRTYTTVGAVSASPLLGSLVNLDVLDDKVSGIKTLGVGIRFSILEQGEQKSSRFNWPASLGDAELFPCGPDCVVSGLYRQRCKEALEIPVTGRSKLSHIEAPIPNQAKGFNHGDGKKYSSLSPSLASLNPYDMGCFLSLVAYDHLPCAHRPVLPAYRLIGTASLCAITFSR
jgi:hypothetical protein